ncbi:MAG TPA: PEP-CTERM sorting domain-containing protein [Thermoguttaceae bacterium]
MRKVFVLSSFVVAFLAMNIFLPIASADWDESDMPWTKWVQRPDLNQGVDVNATYLLDSSYSGPYPPGPAPIYPWNKILADDFPCDKPGPISDIHIWGSWLEDRVAPNVYFKLSIHDDVPVGPGNPYSHPGAELWSTIMSPTAYRLWYEPTNEYFYEPNTDRIIGTDTQIWQYNFDIDPANAFYQEGIDPLTGMPRVYWLDVQAIIPEPPPPPPTPPEDPYPPPQYVFGWKSTDQPWNDDAVFADTDMPGGPPIGPWVDMWHPLTGQSLNLAFAITTIPEPGTIVMLLTACFIGLVTFLRRR